MLGIISKYSATHLLVSTQRTMGLCLLWIRRRNFILKKYAFITKLRKIVFLSTSYCACVSALKNLFQSQVTKLKQDVENDGLSVIVFADWYNVTVMEKIQFYDENTRLWWIPETGGANIPAVNDLLYVNWGVAFGDQVRSGQFTLHQHAPVTFASGTTLIR